MNAEESSTLTKHFANTTAFSALTSLKIGDGGNFTHVPRSGLVQGDYSLLQTRVVLVLSIIECVYEKQYSSVIMIEP